MKKNLIKIFISLLLFVAIFLPTFAEENDLIESQNIITSAKEHILKTTKVFLPIIKRAKEYKQKPERDIESIKIRVEKKRIEEARKRYQLDENYCLSLSNFSNFEYCKLLLEEQKNDCQNSSIYGNHVYIDLGNQVLYAVKNCEIITYTRIISGKNSTPSPVGHYKIYEARGPHWMQGEWFVNMAFYFRGGFALHDAGWRKGVYWKKESRGYYGSHGCINIPKEAMDALWVNFVVGDEVHLYWQIPEQIQKELDQKLNGKEIIDPTEEV